jgi:hypothetical protein
LDAYMEQVGVDADAAAAQEAAAAGGGAARAGRAGGGWSPWALVEVYHLH